MSFSYSIAGGTLKTGDVTTGELKLASNVSAAGLTITAIPANSFSSIEKSTIKANGTVFEINSRVQSDTVEVITATEDLLANNMATLHVTNEPALVVVNFFESLGCTVSTDPGSDFSLSSLQTETIKFENENIRSSFAAKKQIDANMSFTDEDDPFYAVDTTSQAINNQRDSLVSKLQNGSSALSIASYLASYNSSKENTSLKQFAVSSQAGSTQAYDKSLVNNNVENSLGMVKVN